MNLRENNSSLWLQDISEHCIRTSQTTFIAKFKFIIFSIAYIKSKVVQSADIGEINFFFKEFGFGYPTARTGNKSHPTLFSIVKGTFGT